MIIGYAIAGDDNNTFMFDKNDSKLPICKNCGYITNFNYIPSSYKLKNELFDYSSTYDNRTIVSIKFKNFCNKNNYKGLEFKILPNNKEHYSFAVKNIIEYDTNKKLKYENYCNTCKNYESITPAFPVMLKNASKILKDGIYATDIHFASGNEKSPVIIIGLETYEKMKKEKFKGIHFIKIEK